LRFAVVGEVLGEVPLDSVMKAPKWSIMSLRTRSCLVVRIRRLAREVLFRLFLEDGIEVPAVVAELGEPGEVVDAAHSHSISSYGTPARLAMRWLVPWTEWQRPTTCIFVVRAAAMQSMFIGLV